MRSERDTEIFALRCAPEKSQITKGNGIDGSWKRGVRISTAKEMPGFQRRERDLTHCHQRDDDDDLQYVTNIICHYYSS